MLSTEWYAMHYVLPGPAGMGAIPISWIPAQLLESRSAPVLYNEWYDVDCLDIV